MYLATRMLTKRRVQKHLNALPEQFTLDELVERLIFIEKIEKRIQESKDGKTLKEEEFNAQSDKWLK